MFERSQSYEAYFLPGPAELPTDEALRLGLQWLIAQPGRPLIALNAKKVIGNNRLLANAVSDLRLPVVAPPRLWQSAWTGGAVLAPWASDRVLEGIDDDLGDRVAAACVIGWSEGSHDVWVQGHHARDLRSGAKLERENLLDPVVEVALSEAGEVINHNNALVQWDDKAYVVRTLQQLVRAGYRYDVDALCAWATAHGWTGIEVRNLRDYAQRVLDGRKFQLRGGYGPGAGAVEGWQAEAVRNDK